MSFQSFLQRGVRNTVRDLVHQWRHGDPEKLFCEFARQRWPRKTDGPLLLMHQTTWYTSIYAYAFIAHAVAEQLGARLGSFHFARDRVSHVAPLFEAFGAPTLVSPRDEERHAEAARILARDAFAKIATRRDVLDLTLDDVNLGDIIYDSYQRYFMEPTAVIGDPKLLEVIERVFAIYLASQEFLTKHEVAALFTDHAVYWPAGVFTRVALRHHVPVYHVPYEPATIVRLDPFMYHGVPGNPIGRPAGYGSCKLILPFHLFPKLFARLSQEEQEAGIARGRANLEGRLSGKYDSSILPGGTAYHQAGPDAPRLMKTGDRPRVVMMLHDFLDAPHAFRDHLFVDNYQWAVWMLERASQTPYDWYVKAHPNAIHDPVMGAKNAVVLAELKERFPKVTFLDPLCSNNQLVSEGLAAMFTGYGTAGHEFAYLGVPVVNAGDNGHIGYKFNLHARSIEQLTEYVDQAANLKIEIDKREIEEFAYMRYIAFLDRAVHPVSMLPSTYVPSVEGQKSLGTPDALRMAFLNPDELEQRLRAYFKDFFARGKHELRTEDPA